MNESNSLILRKLKVLLAENSNNDLFFEFIDRCDGVDLDKFVNEVDESHYSLEDWVEAFLGFDEWLTKRCISERSFIVMLGYVHCCQEVLPETLEKPSLQVIVNEMLNNYGFQAGDPSQS
ncbi:MAG: hypothetical protein P1U89_16255 [Verrucomicrobiales bacterium]|nr:hypothetical protein [Verrucomicrobiales bacterium]